MANKSSLFPDSFDMSYSFGLADERHLQVMSDYPPLTAWRALSHHIVRYPLDLRVHTQRILLGQNNQDVKKFLPGSLQDLFLVLDNHGYPLRKQLLMLSEQYLSKEEYAFFNQWTTQNTKSNKVQHWWHLGSVLSTGSYGGEPLVKEERAEVLDTGYVSVLEEARACLDYGQLDVAQQLLEEAILKAPESEEIEKELLTIYQYSKNKNQFDKLSQQLLKQGVTLSEEWKACQKTSNSWS
ncbi:MAG: hypothetical protein KAG28_05225 [Cocleimonas sp.]|nr:hypothetical protein [Cocleimonas sp.]